MKRIISILALLAILAGSIYYLTGKSRESHQQALEVEKAMERVKSTLNKAQQKAEERDKQAEQINQ